MTTDPPHPVRVPDPGRLAKISLSIGTWLGVLAFVLFCKAALSQLPPINIPLIRSEFALSTILVYGAMGLVGALIAPFAGFAPPVGGGITAWVRFGQPILTGVALGAAAIGLDHFTHGADFLAHQTGQPTFNVDYPQSLFVYTGGAALAEAFFRFLPLPLLMLLVGMLVRSDTGRKRAFIVVALVASLMEPLLQGGGVIALGGGDKASLFVSQFLPYLAIAYPLNLAAAFAYRRGGLLSPILLRMAYYLVWHVIFGNFLYQAH
jgi:hypothetical protein